MTIESCGEQDATAWIEST
ncbi:hypothetical protein Ac42p150 [Acinetobacter phage Ac42]|nr:hypothetical protein Ac42p150 [Acinetobacter phage Ac42]ADI96388.1 hypothetical protein Ac42p150 [Acinetobacter phage Ac42]